MELKFRAWVKEEKEMVKVHSIHLNTRKVILTGVCFGGNRSMPFDDIILEQYLGFNDDIRTKEFPKGHEIYIGDIVHILAGAEYYGQWEYDFIITIEDFANASEMLSHADYIEVIGNVHTNPETIKEQNIATGEWADEL